MVLVSRRPGSFTYNFIFQLRHADEHDSDEGKIFRSVLTGTVTVRFFPFFTLAAVMFVFHECVFMLMSSKERKDALLLNKLTGYVLIS